MTLDLDSHASRPPKNVQPIDDPEVSKVSPPRLQSSAYVCTSYPRQQVFAIE